MTEQEALQAASAVAPGLDTVRRRLDVQPQRGAAVATLEKGSTERRAMLAALATTAGQPPAA